MQPAGLASFKNRKENISKIYSHENEDVIFSEELEKQLNQTRKLGIIFNPLHYPNENIRHIG